MGRRSGVDDQDLVKRLLDEIKLGASNKDACLLVGISPDAFMAWVRKGEAQSKGKYRSFVNQLLGARAERRKSYKIQIQRAALDRKLGEKHIAGDWRATAFLATVVEKDEFGPRVHLIVEDQLRSAVERLKKEFSGPDDDAILERALSAVAGEVRDGGATEASARASIAFSGLSEESDPASTIRAAAGVPGADV